MLQSNKNKSHRGRSKRVLMSTLLSHLTIINNVPARLDRDFALLLVLPPLPRPDILVREENGAVMCSNYYWWKSLALFSFYSRERDPRTQKRIHATVIARQKDSAARLLQLATKIAQIVV